MHTSITIGIVGVGVVGRTLCQDIVQSKHSLLVYDVNQATAKEVVDTFENNYVQVTQSIEELAAACQTLFLALPTPVCKQAESGYNTRALHSTLSKLNQDRYTYPIIIKSTLSPGTLDAFCEKYSNLQLFHVPEFLSSATANLDVHQPTQPFVLLGAPRSASASMIDRVRVLLGEISGGRQSVVSMGAKETEATKLFCNAFYATKLQLFTEFYSLCQQQNISFDLVRHMMLQQGWVHPMHTQVPGADGRVGVGGACLPKDAVAISTWAEACGDVHTPLIESVGKAITAVETSTNPT